MSDESAFPSSARPLLRNVSFWAMTVTQFLGAFNDNLFKQVILLICIDVAVASAAQKPGTFSDYQSIAQGLFALAFVLFSGFAGFLSDRYSKRRIIVLCKLAEVGIMLLAVVALRSQALIAVLAVLFLMGTHSAYFGPAKYGILPEIFRPRDLPQANGIFLMTTFLAIIFGIAAAGYLKGMLGDFSAGTLGDHFWGAGATFMGIALAGTLASLAVERTAASQPGLAFSRSELVMNRETFRTLRADRPLLAALGLSCVFWFVAGMVPLAVNDFGKRQLFIAFELNVKDERTSLLAACMGIGIAAGCALAGKLSRGRVNFGLVLWGAWGIIGTLLGLAILGVSSGPLSAREWCARLLLTAMGGFAGLFSVPLQVFLQSRAPAGQKGRVIGAMNLFNWIAILLSAGFYKICSSILTSQDAAGTWIFAITAALMLPVALLYHPPDVELNGG